MSTTGDWARFYVVKRNWAITPLHTLENGVCTCVNGVACGDNAGKHPIRGAWTDPSTMIRTEEQVNAAYASHHAWNVGLPTGQINRVVVIDIDPRNGGFNSIDELEQTRPGGPLPATLTAHTGGGGRHLFYSIPPGVVIKKGPMHRDFPGIDIQGEKAQVVLPPSLHKSGIRYTWADGRNGAEDLTPLPDDLLDFFTKRGGTGSGVASGYVDLDELMKKGVYKGARDNELYRVACKVMRQWDVATSDDNIPVAVAIIESINQRAFVPPKSPDSLKRIIGSAIQFIKSDPGGIDNLPEDTQDWIRARAGGNAREGDTEESEGADEPAEEVLDDPEDADDAWDDELIPPDDGGPPDADGLGDKRTGDHRTLTDNGNARRIVDLWGSDIRYTPGRGWFTWGGVHWNGDDEKLQVTELSRQLPTRIIAEIDPTWPGAQQDNHIKWANSSRAATTIRKSAALAEGDPRIVIPAARWDADDWVLGVKNGVLDLRSGKLIPAGRHQYITKKTAIEYDATARDYRWDSFLDQVTQGDRDFQSWLQRVAGYSLTGLTHHEKFFLIYGPQASGKSTFGAVLAHLLGDYTFEMSSDHITNRRQAGGQDDYWLAQLAGRRMVFISEMPEAEAMKEDMVKRLTGGDHISARPIGKDIIHFDMKAKLWIATNHRPQVRDDAMWRRMIAVPFLFKNLAPSADLKPHLLSPQGGLPAALRWAVEGAVMYAQAGDFGTCSAVTEATEEYRRNEDRFSLFLEEDCNLGEGYAVPFAQLHMAYKFWEGERGEGREKGISVIGFTRKIEDRGFRITGRGRKAQVEGVSLVLRDVQANDSGRPSFATLQGRAGWS